MSIANRPSLSINSRPENLRWKANAFRRSDPGKRRILAHSAGPQYGSSVDWRWARERDIYGSSCYPGWSEYQDPGVSDAQRLEKAPVLTQMLDNAIKWDFVRGASRSGEFWTAELQGGRAPGVLSLTAYPTLAISAAG